MSSVRVFVCMCMHVCFQHFWQHESNFLTLNLCMCVFSVQVEPKFTSFFSFELLDADGARVIARVMNENIELLRETSGIMEKI